MNMWVSEVKTKREIKKGGTFCHRKTFKTLEEGLEWARELGFRIAEFSVTWTDEDIVMNHFEIKG
jgi:hypothetical protein|tara:strand:- start:794 stop:988 length:195 start_codon:yes stop_codon:yes gene_type:complete